MNEINEINVKTLYNYFCKLDIKKEFENINITERKLEIWKEWNELPYSKFEFILWKVLTEDISENRLIEICGTYELSKILTKTLIDFKIIKNDNSFQKNKAIDFSNVIKEKNNHIERYVENKSIYGQLSCTSSSSQKRASILMNLVPKWWNTIFLGDDDLTSLYFHNTYKNNITVMDIDEDLLKFIKKEAPEIKTIKHNITLPIKDTMIKNKFNCVHLDPSDDSNGLEIWLLRSLESLTGEPGNLIFLNINLTRIGKREYYLHKFLCEQGFIVKQKYSNLSEYFAYQEPSMGHLVAEDNLSDLKIYSDLIIFERIITDERLFPSVYFNKRRLI